MVVWFVLCAYTYSCIVCHVLVYPPNRNIDELQEQNQWLLMVIRDISDQQEQQEQEMIDEK